MASSRAEFRQDMPPRGGYGAIQWEKVPGRKRMSGRGIFGAFAAVSLVGWIGYYFEYRAKRRNFVEMNDGRLAIYPLLLAEEQRLYLRQLRANRDEENELMKNVPGWKTGTWYGEPVYHNLNKRYPVIHPEEYYSQARYFDMFDRIYERRKH